MSTFLIYVIKTVVKYLFFVSLLVILLLELSSFYGIAYTLSESKYTLQELMFVAISSSLIDINKVIPIIMALTVIVSVLILMRGNELLAYMTIGGSIVKLVIPFLIIGVVISSCMIYIEYNVVPVARQYKDSELKRIKNGNVSTGNITGNITGFNNTWLVGHDNVITNIGFVSLSDKKVYDVVEYLLDNNTINKIVKIGIIEKKGNDWVADNITVNNITTNPPKIINVGSRVLEEGTSIWEQMVSLSTTNIKALTPRELYTMIQISESKGISSAEYEISLYFKIASAVSVIVLVLFLFPISINFARNFSIVKNATITLVLTLVFMISQTVGRSLGDSGVLSPFIATFGHVILFLILSIFLIYFKSRAR